MQVWRELVLYYLLDHLQSFADDYLLDLLHLAALDLLIKEDVLLNIGLEIVFIQWVVQIHPFPIDFDHHN